MSEFNKKKHYKKFLYSPITLFVLTLILLVLLKALWGVYQKERMSSEYLAKEQIELEKAGERQKTLEKSVEYLKTDKGVEAEIRSKFRMVKEGEMVAVIIDEDKKSVEKPATTTTPIGFWQSIFNWFK